jgi:hypothetical protein
MAANPTFATIPHVEMAQVTTANTLRDGTGVLVTIFTAGTNGSRFERVRIKAVANTSSSNQIRFFISDGVNTRIIRETQMVAVTASATVTSFEAVETFGMVLPFGWSIRASTVTAEVYNLIAEGADL